MESFNIVKRGYDPREVDEYIETLEQVIKSYKDKDNAIKNAIISAQVAADNILKNTHKEVSEYKSNTLFHLKNIYESVEAQRGRLQAFQNDYKDMIDKYLRMFEDADAELIAKRIDDLENYLRSLASSITADEH